MSKDEVLLTRGTADALALHRRYHDDQTHYKYVPDGNMARDIYEALEVTRCEAMGARDMPGRPAILTRKLQMKPSGWL